MTVRIQRVTDRDLGLFEILAPEVFDEAIQPERLAAYLAQETNIMLLAVERQTDGSDLTVGQCAAVLHLHPDKPTELYVDELGTASTHRRQGIGRRLMHEILAWGEELGCVEGWLGTELDNKPARALYEDLFDPGEEIVMYDFDIDELK